MFDLSIVILSFNTKELLRDCLLSIKNSQLLTLNCELIVVDNASTDGSVQMVKDEFKDVTLIANKKNVGYSSGNNQGVKKAKGKYVLFLNADTVVYDGTLNAMVRFMEENKKAGAATCWIQLPNGKLDDSCHRGFPTPWRSFCHFSGLSRTFPNISFFAGYSLSYMDLTKTHEIESCSGAFMIVRREAGEEVARQQARQVWWDEDFFWYGDDLDFCYRLKEKDWQIYFVPEVKILHYKGVSGGIKKISKHLTTASRETVVRATNARFNAMKIFYDKHYNSKYPQFVKWLVFLAINLKWWLTLRSI